MLTRSLPPTARLQVGNFALLSEVFPDGKVSDVQEVWLVTENEVDHKGSPCKIPKSAPRIKDFMDEQVGHTVDLTLPSGTKRLKLVGIHERLPDESGTQEGTSGEDPA